MPFTTEPFFGVFAACNETVWPLQILAYAAGLLALALLLRPSRTATAGILAVLALFWEITGAAHHGPGSRRSTRSRASSAPSPPSRRCC